MDSTSSVKRTQGERGEPEPPDGALPRLKRPKSSKACSACRKQKSRCEKLAGELDACHRCNVIGIACVFDANPTAESVRTRKPRPLLPRLRADVAQVASWAEHSTLQNSSNSRPLDTARLHALADTTEMVSRPASDRTSPSTAGHRPLLPQASPLGAVSSSSTKPASKTTISPETLSTVESTVFPSPRDSTSESQCARIRADWRRWVAPLTLLQSLVRHNHPTPSMSPISQPLAHPTSEDGTITPLQERRLKEHFRLRYLPWLPAVQFTRQTPPNCLDNLSPFLTTVICATAARTLAEVSAKSVEHLRSLALHHVGTVFSNPSAHRGVDSLYALLVLILWPLDPADDVVLLINGAKQLAVAHERSRGVLHTSSGSSASKPDSLDADHMRLWYTICASETIFSLGSGSHASPPALETLVACFGSASDVALESGNPSDILIILQTSLHRIIAAAKFENEQKASLMGGPSPLKYHERLLHYISTVHMSLTRLGEWEIEFHSISAESEGSDAVNYVALEIEYHYLCLMLVTHCLLTLCHVCPLVSAPDEAKSALWSWSITGNKSAHAAVRLFNAFTQHDPGHAAPLASAPDRIFAMIVVSVMLILRHQVASYEYGRRRGAAELPPAGFTKQAENAIRKAAERMAGLGRGGSADHAAARYVEIMEALLRIWGEKRTQKDVCPDGPPCELQTDARMNVPEQLIDRNGGFGEGAGLMQMNLDLSLLGGDVFSDSAFPWDGIGSLDCENLGQ